MKLASIAITKKIFCFNKWREEGDEQEGNEALPKARAPREDELDGLVGEKHRPTEAQKEASERSVSGFEREANLAVVADERKNVFCNFILTQYEIFSNLRAKYLRAFLSLLQVYCNAPALNGSAR